MAEVSADPGARARKAQTTILQRLALQGTQARLAAHLQVDEATVSRWKESVERSSQVLTFLGLKVVPVEMVCVAAQEIGMLRDSYMKTLRHAPWVLNEEPE